MLDPVAVALKFGFIAVLFLFILWVTRSALKDLRGEVYEGPRDDQYDDATGIHTAIGHAEDRFGPGDLRVVQTGARFELSHTVVMGRGDRVTIRIDDPFASSQHAQVTPQGEALVLEDLGSTNGTYLNEELVRGPQPLHDGDRIRIGDCEIVCER